MDKINYVSLCSGYGAECLAFKRLRRDHPGFDFECVAWSEIEPNACKAHDAIHPEYAGRNLGDMTVCDYSAITAPVDILFYSTPCQSVSNAGKNAGMKKGDDAAASALIWHTERAIRELKPRICILENVKGMVSKRNKVDFDEWCATLEKHGYVNYWKILNSTAFGVAQNRERVFMVSILRTEAEPCPQYHFPKGFPLTKCVEDYMEPAEDVGEEYYISQDRVTNKVLSDILDQPNVREEMEKLYHAEWSFYNANGRWAENDDELEAYEKAKQLEVANSSERNDYYECIGFKVLSATYSHHDFCYWAKVLLTVTDGISTHESEQEFVTENPAEEARFMHNTSSLPIANEKDLVGQIEKAVHEYVKANIL